MEKRQGQIKSPAVPAGDYEIYHIGVLDGIRAVSVLFVVWYHFWQQTWIAPVWGEINLDWLVRNGSILVDMMILLSGFCLFLPYAREMVYGEKTDTAAAFYIKRVARIVPSYLLSILIVFLFFALPLGEYMGDMGFLAKDVLTHLTFTHNLFDDVMRGTHLNGVLWTVGVEMQLYLIFPLLARWFRRYPVQTYTGMLAVGLSANYYISSHFNAETQALFVNHTVTFLAVYANGMLGAWIYMKYTKWRRKKNLWEGIAATAVAVGSVFVFRQMCDWRMQYGNEAKWQVDNRFLLSLLFLVFLLSVILSLKGFRKIWDNRVMVFLASISFNFYICHQFISVRLKEFKIPYWDGEQPPNMTGDSVWQWEYMWLCIVISFLVAAAMTFLIERPAAKMIRKFFDKRRKVNE